MRETCIVDCGGADATKDSNLAVCSRHLEKSRSIGRVGKRTHDMAAIRHTRLFSERGAIFGAMRLALAAGMREY